ncbi:CcdC protein domain-containing protein [Scopulibacillus cellulosilyticus]|uniref:CcdC protein domain-containing protein n=1 Tax=Scopulibacillus cellulosilyticus TaxID=2665665 RepID=A0ABW2PXM9_9BACL
MNQHYYIIVIVAVICLGIFKRVRRNIGWQKFESSRMIVRTVIFTIIGAIFLFESLIHPIALISDIVGIAIGLILAYYGITTTTFEKRGEHWYYRNNPWIGGIVTALFFGRLIYRFYMMYSMTHAGGQNAFQQSNSLQNMTQMSNPWTAGLILIMFAYYAAYFVLLLRKKKGLTETAKGSYNL